MEIRASHILVGSKELAEEIAKKLENGENFSKLAQNYSKCPSKKKGGDLGFFKRGQMVKEFDRFCFSHKKGERGIVKTQFGWHIIEITGVKK